MNRLKVSDKSISVLNLTGYPAKCPLGGWVSDYKSINVWSFQWTYENHRSLQMEQIEYKPEEGSGTFQKLLTNTKIKSFQRIRPSSSIDDGLPDLSKLKNLNDHKNADDSKISILWLLCCRLWSGVRIYSPGLVKSVWEWIFISDATTIFNVRKRVKATSNRASLTTFRFSIDIEWSRVD